MNDRSKVSKDCVQLEEARDAFIQEWGRMSSGWGINRTMAQIHALLFISGEAHTMDEICDRLHISRGNASMNLRSLMDWNVIKRYRNPGERHDTYVSEADAVSMVARVLRERKRREIDPTVAVLESCLEMLPTTAAHPDVASTKRKIEGLLGVFDLIDKAYKLTLSTDERLRLLLESREQISAVIGGLAESRSS
jgi:DNA-binding transcriptional regulator GbsR (MarR family)